MGAGGRWRICTLLVLALIMLNMGQPALASNPGRDTLEFWRSNYAVITPGDTPLAKRAHEVFQRVLAAAGFRRGVVPRLLIIKKDSLEVLALPDGGIILSSGALERCYANSKYGDDRLAFLLGHEIAHQLKDDFWHMKFFQAVDDARAHASQADQSLASAEKIARKTDQVLAKELSADEHGIVYAAMAGYNPAAIVSEDGKVNFFAEWVAALDPARLPGVVSDSTHPSAAVRAATVKARLRQVLEKLDVFELGLKFYEVGQYRHAIDAFREFLVYFPSREVYLDLAASHHQLALEYYLRWKDKPPVPFMLPLVADQTSRATKVVVRGSGEGDSEQLFHQHLSKAIALYRTAITQDPDYPYAYENLASALIVNGDAYEAVGLLRRASKQLHDVPTALTSELGVAYYYADNPAKAEEVLHEVLQAHPHHAPALFNLAMLKSLQNKPTEAKALWRAYLKSAPAGSWASFARAELAPKTAVGDEPASIKSAAPESLDGVEVGAYDDEVPGNWGPPETQSISVGETPYHENRYRNGIATVSRDGEILLLTASEGFKGKTVAGIARGATEQDVIHAYGDQAQIKALSQGQVWVYRNRHLAFLLRNRNVVSWTLYGH